MDLPVEERQQIENEMLFRRAIEKVVLKKPKYSVVKKNHTTPEPGPDFNITSIHNI